MQFDESANGREVDVHLNDEFEITLPETRTAGYRWATKSKGEPPCLLVKESSASQAGKAGGSNTHHWQFRAVSIGIGDIELLYGRSWEESSAPTQTFKMKIRVGP
jgi:predicted secreted protein